MQTVFQFQAKIPEAFLSVGDHVLGKYETHPTGMTGKWQSATIVSKNEDDTYDLAYVHEDEAGNMERHLIQKWDIAGDISVFVRDTSQGEWDVGKSWKRCQKTNTRCMYTIGWERLQL